MLKPAIKLPYAVFLVEIVNAQFYGPALPPSLHKGCELTLGNAFGDKEPRGEPLLLHVSITIPHLRDVADSGGSFGVDIK